MKDCRGSTVEIEVFLGEVNSSKYFVAIKTSNLHQTLKHF
jgi:hypothetical protein